MDKEEYYYELEEVCQSLQNIVDDMSKNNEFKEDIIYTIIDIEHKMEELEPEIIKTREQEEKYLVDEYKRSV